MRIESRIGLIFLALSNILKQFTFLQNPTSDFFSGLFVGLGIFLIFVSMLSESVYDKLLYRKLIVSKKGK